MFFLLFLQIIQGENEEKYEGFKLLNSEELLNFTHVKSGCHIIFSKVNGELLRKERPYHDYESISFNIGLYTPLQNKHGISHILMQLLRTSESSKYPPVNNLHNAIRGSALDSSTFYYGSAAENEKFMAQLDVAMDKVFSSEFTEYDFRREAWRFVEEDNKIRITGSVFSERKRQNKEYFKGSFERFLFPDSHLKYLSYDSDFVIESNFENTTDYYRDYYHPSNAQIYISSENMYLVPEVLKVLKSHLDKFSFKKSIKKDFQKPFSKIKNVTTSHLAAYNNETIKKSYFKLNGDLEASIYAGFLSRIDNAFVYNRNLDVISIASENVDSFLLEYSKNFQMEKYAKKLIQLQKEIKVRPFPRKLVTSILNRGKNPLDILNLPSIVEKILKEKNEGVKQFIENYLINNKHRVNLISSPFDRESQEDGLLRVINNFPSKSKEEILQDNAYFSAYMPFDYNRKLPSIEVKHEIDQNIYIYKSPNSKCDAYLYFDMTVLNSTEFQLINILKYLLVNSNDDYFGIPVDLNLPKNVTALRKYLFRNITSDYDLKQTLRNLKSLSDGYFVDEYSFGKFDLEESQLSGLEEAFEKLLIRTKNFKAEVLTGVDEGEGEKQCLEKVKEILKNFPEKNPKTYKNEIKFEERKVENEERNNLVKVYDIQSENKFLVGSEAIYSYLVGEIFDRNFYKSKYIDRGTPDMPIVRNKKFVVAYRDDDSSCKESLKTFEKIPEFLLNLSEEKIKAFKSDALNKLFDNYDSTAHFTNVLTNFNITKEIEIIKNTTMEDIHKFANLLKSAKTFRGIGGTKCFP